MKRRSFLFGGLCVLLAGCGRTEKYRYRMSVMVDTPQGVRSGSSVIEVRNSEAHSLEGTIPQGRVKGEAVAVDLPDGQTLFAVLQDREGNNGGFASAAYQPTANDNDDWYIRTVKLKHQSGPADVSRKYYPIFVRFVDINDPASVQAVNPDDLSASFGPGYRLRSVVAEITDDPVTSGILDRLPWLKSHRGSLDPGDGLHPDYAHPEKQLLPRDFKQG